RFFAVRVLQEKRSMGAIVAHPVLYFSDLLLGLLRSCDILWMFWRCYPAHSLAIFYQRPNFARLHCYHLQVSRADQASFYKGNGQKCNRSPRHTALVWNRYIHRIFSTLYRFFAL